MEVGMPGPSDEVQPVTVPVKSAGSAKKAVGVAQESRDDYVQESRDEHENSHAIDRSLELIRRLYPLIWLVVSDALGEELKIRNLNTYVIKFLAFSKVMPIEDSHVTKFLDERLEDVLRFLDFSEDARFRLESSSPDPERSSSSPRGSSVDDSERIEKYVTSDGRDLGLELRQSSIPNAGRGLFASTKIPKDRWICVYYGEPMRLVEVAAASREQNSAKLDYVLGGFGLFSVDAKNSVCAARFLNHSAEPNCEFRFKSRGLKKAICVAKRDVRPGEELFVDYGPGYWKMRAAQDISGDNFPAKDVRPAEELFVDYGPGYWKLQGF